MGNFNYSKLHFFDKQGQELPLIYDTNLKIKFPGLYKEESIFYGITDSSKTIVGYYPHTTGGRCSNSTSQFANILHNNEIIESNLEVELGDLTASSSYADNSNFKYIRDIVSEINISNLSYPSLSFTSSLNFNRISTDLVETNTIYVLVEKEDGTFTKINDVNNSNDTINWSNRYKLVFFIDTRSQKDFRFFNSSDNDEIAWSNKAVISYDDNIPELLSSIDIISDYRIDIGFKAAEEGIYEDDIVVCLIDTLCNEDSEDFIQPIGVIRMHAEAVGEDERYRSLFQNFGIPHPAEYHDVFANTDKTEALVDNIELNENAKRLFLSYSDIFPYTGSYKALINAINALGYTDLYFKEWYKETGKAHNKNIAFDISYNNTSVINTIKNVSLTDRIKLKKLNWLSIIYKINDIIAEQGEDEYGFPFVKNVHGYNNNELAVKLISLKEWLEKYIIGLNCRIIDVGGEGIFFERYKVDTYGTYQSILEYGKTINIAPSIIDSDESRVLLDASIGTEINVDLGINTDKLTFEDLKTSQYVEFCDGYISNGIYHELTNVPNEDSSILFVGGSIECLTPLRKYSLRAQSSSPSFLFGEKYVYTEISSSAASLSLPRLLLQEDRLTFNPIDLFNGAIKEVIFKKNPVIKINKGQICSLNNRNNDVSTGEVSILHNIESFDDNVMLLPKPHTGVYPQVVEVLVNDLISGDPINEREAVKKFYKIEDNYSLKYSAENCCNIPLLEITENGYDLSGIDNNLSSDELIFLDILDGDIIFYDNKLSLHLNFYTDEDGDRKIRMNFIQSSDEYSVIKYINGESESYSFVDGQNYNAFVTAYDSSADLAIEHNFEVPIAVHNTGEFSIDVLGKDWQNNTYAAKCNNRISVSLPEVGIKSYTNDSSAGLYKTIVKSVESDELDILKNRFNEFCVFEYTPIIADASVSVKRSGDKLDYSVNYPAYSYAYSTPKKNEFIHFTNAKYKIGVQSIDFEETLFKNATGASSVYASYGITGNPEFQYNKKFLNNNELGAKQIKSSYEGVYDMYSTDTLLFSKINDISDDTHFNGSNENDYMSLFGDSINKLTDVNVVLYNELGGYPLTQIYAQMSHDANFYNLEPSVYNNVDLKRPEDSYKIITSDDTHKGYIYASVKDYAEKEICENIAKFIYDEFDKNKEHICTYKSIISPTIENDTSEEINIVEDNNDETLSGPIIPELSFFSDIDKEVANNLGLEIFNEYYKNKTTASTLINIDNVSDTIIIGKLPYNNTLEIPDASNIRSYDITNASNVNVIANDSSFIYLPMVYEYDASSGFTNSSSYNVMSDVSTNLIDDIRYTYLFLNYPENKESFIETGFNYINIKFEANDSSINDKTYLEYVFDSSVLDASIDNDVPEKVRKYIEDYIGIDFTPNEDIIKDIISIVYDECYNIDTTSADSQRITRGEIRSIINKLYETLCGKSEDFKFMNIAGADDDTAIFVNINDIIDTPAFNNINSSTPSGFWHYFKLLIKDELLDLSSETSSDDDKYRSYLKILFVLYSYFAIVYARNISITADTKHKTLLYNSSNHNLLFDYLKLTEIDLQSRVIVMIQAVTNGLYTMLHEQTIVQQEGEKENKILKVLCEPLFDISSYSSSINTTSVYNKLLSGYMYDIFTNQIINPENSNEEVIVIGNITSHTDSNTGENLSTAKYAVTYKIDDTRRYYLKSMHSKSSGLTYVGEKFPLNQSKSITKLLDKSCTSLYVNSNRRDKVFISNKVKEVNNSSIISEFFVSLPKDLEELKDKFFYVMLESSDYANLYNPGEKIKLISESLTAKEVIGQATYTVLYRVDNKLILVGDITKEYFSDSEVSIYGIIPIDPSTGNQFERAGSTEFELASGEQVNVVQIGSISINSLITGDSMVYNNTAPLNTIFYPIYLLSSISDERVNMYISPTHHSYVDYKLLVNNSIISKDDNSTSVPMVNINIKEKEYSTNRIMDFIDDSFGIKLSRFDINNGIAGWMNYIIEESASSEILTPDIVNDPVYKFENTPLLLKNTNNVVLSPIYADDLNSELFTTYWKIFRIDPISSQRTLYFESYNNSLYLDISKEGCYDIELTVYDELGNSITKTFNSAITIA